MHGWKLIVVLLVCSVAIVGSIAPASAEETAELTIDLSTDESFVPPSGTRPLESEPFISRSRVTVATVDDFVAVVDAAVAQGLPIRLHLFDDVVVVLANVVEGEPRTSWRAQTNRNWSSDVHPSTVYDDVGARVSTTADRTGSYLIVDIHTTGGLFFIESYGSGSNQLQVGEYSDTFPEDFGDDTSTPAQFPRDGVGFVLLVTIVPIVAVSLLWLSGKRASEKSTT